MPTPRKVVGIARSEIKVSKHDLSRDGALRLLEGLLVNGFPFLIRSDRGASMCDLFAHVSL